MIPAIIIILIIIFIATREHFKNLQENDQITFERAILAADYDGQSMSQFYFS